MGELEVEDVAWSQLVYDFTQESTLHGVRYVTGPSRYCTRRLAWSICIMVAFGGFVWINIENLYVYFDHPKSVNVELTFESNLTFPSVTICNYNSFRLTKLVDLGLFDQFHAYYNADDLGTSQGDCPSTFTYLEGMCIHNETERLQVFNNSSWAFSVIYEGISEIACEIACARLHDLDCSGIIYNRTSHQCEVTSIVLNSKDATPGVTCGRQSLEYYRRNRCPIVPNIRCEFEIAWIDGFNLAWQCPMTNLTIRQSQETWIPALAGNNEPTADFNLDSGRGAYMYMIATDKRPSYSAWVNFPFLSFENTCIEFYYYIVGDKEFTIEVSALTEELVEVAVGAVNSSATPQWRRFFARLPDGMFVLAIGGSRPSLPVISAAAIDSIVINNCDFFYQECRRTEAGMEYMGKVNRTASGVSCLSWDATIYANASFPDGSATEAGNYCRNPVTTEIMGSQPWCMVDTTVQENCIVPFCECESTYFRCSSGKCIPQMYTCDGVNDCGDMSDEDDPSVCPSLLVSCNFDEEYACGYVNLDQAGLSFMRKKAYEVDDGLGPTVDTSGSSLGPFMYVDSRDGVEGDIAVLVSPNTNRPDTSACLFFYMYYVQSPSSTFNRFAIVLRYAEMPYAIHPYSYQVSTWTATGWTPFLLQLPGGAYSVLFEYVMGFPYECSIAVDDIKIVSCSDYPEQSIVHATNTTLGVAQNISCTFNGGDTCGMDYITDNHMARWTLIPRLYLSNLANHEGIGEECSNHYYAMSGIFDSPGYPSAYSSGHSDCVAHILAPPGANITLTILKFDLEMSTNCTADYVEILSGEKKGTPVQVLCGDDVEGMVIEIEQHEAWVLLHTDTSLQGKGFRIKYDLSSLPEEDYVAMLYYDGQVSSSFYEAAFYTQLLELDDVACLAFSYLTTTTFHVKLLGSADVTALSSIRSEQPKSWNRVRVTIPAGSYQIAFIATFEGGDKGWRSLLDDLVLHTGLCDEVYEKGTVECGFGSIGQCGYMDVSNTAPRWLRYVEKTLGNYVMEGMAHKATMQVDLANFEVGTRTLMSPSIQVTSDSCVQFRFYALSDGILLRVFTARRVNDMDSFTLAGFVYADPGWSTCNVNIPPGTYRLLFSVMGINNLIQLTNITTYPDSCTQQDDMVILDPDVDLLASYAQDIEINRGLYYFDDPEVSPESIPLYTNPTSTAELRPSSRKDVTAFIDVKNLFSYTAHKKADLIYSCTWNSSECPENSFIEEYTDFGVCYTFNPGPNYMQLATSDQAGSRRGLRLTLNVETYQHSHNDLTDAGVKVHLHKWDQHFSVRDVGFAAAPSTHTLLSARYTESYSLPHPYGTCSSIPLKLFPNDTYTYERCRAQSEALTLNHTCSCRHFYMPDMGTEYCTVMEYLDCVLTDWAQAPDTEDVGVCPDECAQVDFELEPSFTSLSVIGVNQLLSTNTSRLSQQYVTATELRRRFEPTDLLATITALDQVEDAFENFMTFAEQATALSATSLYRLIETSLGLFSELLMADAGVAFANTSYYRSTYRMAYSWKHSSVKSHVESAIKAVSLMTETAPIVRHILLPTINGSASAEQIEMKKMQALVESVLDSVQLAFSAMNFPISDPAVYFAGEIPSIAYLPTTIFPSKHIENMCSRGIMHHMRDLGDVQGLTLGLVEIDSVLELLDAIDEVDWTSIQFDLDGFAKDYTTCSSYYPNFINNINNLVAEINGTDQLTLDNNFNFEQESEQVYNDQLWFTNVIKQPYIENKLSKAGMAAILTSEQIAAMEVNVANIRSLIATKFSDVMNERITEQIEQFGGAYDTILSVLMELQEYFASTKLDCTQVARSLQIWRIPISSLYGNNLLIFKYAPDEVWHTWPSYMDINAFSAMVATNALESVHLGFFDELSKAITEIDTALDGLQEDITEALNNLGDDLNEYTTSLEINEDFIIDNFLTLDVYYGELVFHMMEQQASYQLDSFFSDLGGYMGLLLGGSAVTIAEVLDLILYNLILKCSYSDQKRKKAAKAAKNVQVAPNNAWPTTARTTSRIFDQMAPDNSWSSFGRSLDSDPQLPSSAREVRATDELAPSFRYNGTTSGDIFGGENTSTSTTRF